VIGTVVALLLLLSHQSPEPNLSPLPSFPEKIDNLQRGYPEELVRAFDFDGTGLGDPNGLHEVAFYDLSPPRGRWLAISLFRTPPVFLNAEDSPSDFFKRHADTSDWRRSIEVVVNDVRFVCAARIDRPHGGQECDWQDPHFFGQLVLAYDGDMSLQDLARVASTFQTVL
jgi:hypothetical protein